MRAFSLIVLALLAVVGHAFDTHPWPRALDTHSLDSRSPKGGSKSGGGSSSSGDDDDDEEGGCVADKCPSNRELCGNMCIPTGTTCCDEGGTQTSYCEADERCVRRSDELMRYKCCPRDDESCDEESANATSAPKGKSAECGSGAAAVSGTWAVGAVGAVGAIVAFGL